MKDYMNYRKIEIMIHVFGKMIEYVEFCNSSIKNLQEQWLQTLAVSVQCIIELGTESEKQKAQIAKLQKELEQKQQEIDGLKRENSKTLQMTSEDSLKIAELKKELKKKDDRIVVLNGIIQRMQNK